MGRVDELLSVANCHHAFVPQASHELHQIRRALDPLEGLRRAFNKINQDGQQLKYIFRVAERFVLINPFYYLLITKPLIVEIGFYISLSIYLQAVLLGRV